MSEPKKTNQFSRLRRTLASRRKNRAERLELKMRAALQDWVRAGSRT